VVTPLQGEIWWAETEERKRRPVVVVTRSHAIPVLDWIVVAPVTRNVRGISTEIPLGRDEGLTIPCAARFDNLQPVRRAFLTERVGALARPRLQICRALEAVADC
jgi:mRNA interferase MazF